MRSTSWAFRVHKRIIAIATGAWVTAAATLGGCTGSAAASTSEAIVEVRHGESVAAASGALEIRFEFVASDSRCPKGETCVWEGDAIVVLSVRAPGQPPARLELHTSARGPSSVGYDGWTIGLATLEPYPVSGRTIVAAEYVATLNVTRGGYADIATQ